MHAAVTEMIIVIGIVIVVRGVNEAVQLVAMLMRIGACGFCRAFKPGYDDPGEDRDDYGSGHCARSSMMIRGISST
jgi:hypothetical protein